MGLGKLDVHTHNDKIRPISIISYKKNSKWIKDLSMKPETAEKTMAAPKTIQVWKALPDQGCLHDSDVEIPSCPGIKAQT